MLLLGCHQQLATEKFEHLRYKDKCCYYYGLGISSFKLLGQKEQLGQVAEWLKAHAWKACIRL